MVEESVEHAFSDLAARRWIEAKLRADQTLTATRKALADSAGELESDYRAKIQTAMHEVESALATEVGVQSRDWRDCSDGTLKRELQPGDLKQLQAAIAALDEVTKPLADLLMDRAMEAMLRKRGVIQ